MVRKGFFKEVPFEPCVVQRMNRSFLNGDAGTALSKAMLLAKMEAVFHLLDIHVSFFKG